MNDEIEYKFLVDRIPDCYEVKEDICQTYLYLEDVIEFAYKKLGHIDFKKIDVCRVRIVKSFNTKFYLTLKSSGLILRKEYECEISEDEAKSLLVYKNKGTVKKQRYIFNVNDLTFEFDEYYNSKLKTAEVEIQNLKMTKYMIYSILKKKFKLKFKDITLDEKYKNKNLAIKEIKNNEC